ncbi:MAG: KTSC domain-containing protein [Syntrophorhabdus sp.]|nr:KTSC domain-containing protein [Syntrophorhabdus sp.]
MIYVDSSNIEAIGYDDDAQELHVRFLSGGYYVYLGVPRQIYDNLMMAPSKGSFLNREIKNVYQFTKQ